MTTNQENKSENHPTTQIEHKMEIEKNEITTLSNTQECALLQSKIASFYQMVQDGDEESADCRSSSESSASLSSYSSDDNN